MAKPAMQHFTLSQARRIALAAQGFATPRPKTPITLRHIHKTIAVMGVLQIDSINVLARSHYLPLFSRLGAYDRQLLHRAAEQHPRKIFEYWAHEASFIPVETHHLLRWRMEAWQKEAWRETRLLAQEQPELLQAVLREVTQHGPLTTNEVEQRLQYDAPKTKDQWGWNWSHVKTALEALFWAGEITAASRNSQFQRLYSASKNVLPSAHLLTPTPTRHEATRQLVAIAAKAHGIASASCLRDYFRLSAADTKTAIDELVEINVLQLATVEGWDKQLYYFVGAKLPRHIHARALLSPFDPLIFERKRIAALFNFKYGIEVYTPQAKRIYGYYVLPFLLGEQLVARVDLKADRQQNKLIVRGAFAERDAPENTAMQLAQELRDMAAWLGLSSVLVEANGNLAAALQDAILVVS